MPARRWTYSVPPDVHPRLEAALAVNTLAKAAEFPDAAGAVIGKLIALMGKIAAAATVADAETVIW